MDHIELKAYVFDFYARKGEESFSAGEFDQALEYFQEAAKLNPDRAEAHLYMAKALLRLAELKQAGLQEDILQDAIKCCDTAIGLKYDLAEAYGIKNNALFILKKSEKDPQKKVQYDKELKEYASYYCFYKGIELKQSGNLEKASDFFWKATMHNDRFAEGYFEYALTLKEFGQINDSIENFKKAIEFSSNKTDDELITKSLDNIIEAYGEYALTLKNLGNLKAATTCFVYYYFYNGMKSKVSKQIEETIENFKKAIEFSNKTDFSNDELITKSIDNLLEAYFDYAAQLQDSGQSDAAKEVFAYYYFYSGIKSERSGEREAAIDFFSKAIELNPSLIEAYLKKAEALFKLEKISEVLECCEVVINLYPNCAEAHLHMAKAFSKLEAPLLSIEYCNTAIELKPYLVEAHYLKKDALFKLSELEEDQTKKEEYLKESKESAAYYEFYKGIEHLEKEGFNEGRSAANDCFRRAIGHKDDFANAEFCLGLIIKKYDGLEGLTLSKEYFSKAIEHKQDDDDSSLQEDSFLKSKGMYEMLYMDSKDGAITETVESKNGHVVDALIALTDGMMFSYLGESKAAIECYQQVIQLDPDMLSTLGKMLKAQYPDFALNPANNTLVNGKGMIILNLNKDAKYYIGLEFKKTLERSGHNVDEEQVERFVSKSVVGETTLKENPLYEKKLIPEIVEFLDHTGLYHFLANLYLPIIANPEDGVDPAGDNPEPLGDNLGV